jgi:hypothetical protein
MSLVASLVADEDLDGVRRALPETAGGKSLPLLLRRTGIVGALRVCGMT